MNSFLELIYEYGLFAMILIIFLEYSCFPVSSEIVLPFSGAFASLRCISFITVVILSVIAGLAGTSVCYFIGRKGGTRIIDKIKKHFPKSEKGFNASFEKFEKYGGYIVCFGRLVPLCRTYIAFIAGTSGQNYRQYITFSLFGITVWNSILIGLGYYLRENWNLVKDIYNRYKHILIPVIILIILFFIYRFVCKKRRSR